MDGFPAVLGPDRKYHYHTAPWWLKNWATARSLTVIRNPDVYLGFES